MKDQYVKLTVFKFIKHNNPFLIGKIGSTAGNSSNSTDVNILHMNSVFLIQNTIINQMLSIYFRIDISDKIISELIFQTNYFRINISDKTNFNSNGSWYVFHYVCIVETQPNCNEKDFSDKEYYNNRINLLVCNQRGSQQLN